MLAEVSGVIRRVNSLGDRLGRDNFKAVFTGVFAGEGRFQIVPVLRRVCADDESVCEIPNILPVGAQLLRIMAGVLMKPQSSAKASSTSSVESLLISWERTLGNSTGNPGVCPANPDPYPQNPVPLSRVPGITGRGPGFRGFHGFRVTVTLQHSS